MSQASPEYRLDEQALNNMFVRNGTEMAPLSQFVTLKRVLGPEVSNRFNLFSCITVNVNPAPGYSTGEVQQAIEEVAAQMLPTGYGYEYGGMAREEANTGGSQTLDVYKRQPWNASLTPVTERSAPKRSTTRSWPKTS